MSRNLAAEQHGFPASTPSAQTLMRVHGQRGDPSLPSGPPPFAQDDSNLGLSDGAGHFFVQVQRSRRDTNIDCLCTSVSPLTARRLRALARRRWPPRSRRHTQGTKGRGCEPQARAQPVAAGGRASTTWRYSYANLPDSPHSRWDRELTRAPRARPYASRRGWQGRYRHIHRRYARQVRRSASSRRVGTCCKTNSGDPVAAILTVGQWTSSGLLGLVHDGAKPGAR
jgi:hypothetical protein